MINAFIAGFLIPVFGWQIKLHRLNPKVWTFLPVLVSLCAICLNVGLAVSPPS